MSERLPDKFRIPGLGPRYLSVKDVAEILNLRPAQVRKLPVPYSRMSSRCIRYNHEDLVAAGYLSPDPLPHWVYFVGYQNKIKIGSAKKVWKRFAELQCGSPVPLAMLGIMDGGPDLEAELHKRWDDRRGRGEWFFATEEMHSFIKENTRKPGPSDE